ncbi:restriction endonuclease [Pelagovum pacificum]|uniref:Restriction endonuclease n=1 Tax=Pelagovum pacificum TaxID=2588711 RepID=A0A5C5G7W5_9RHOB|nr:restriction endonuclease [Pelagovum pacificum]QQA41523.1 restriction endonuclease [Pelagovum pacificum]TNY30804.1 restriction endonuclease [Pelagovum pacificum]
MSDELLNPSVAAQSPSDAELDVVVNDLQRSIQEWAIRHELWFDCGFKSFAERVGGEPGEPPVVTILHFDGDLGRALDGDFHGLDIEFFDLLARQGFWYERNDSASVYLYPEDNSPLFQPFLDRENWQWVCGLVQQDVADVYEELYSYFARRPEDLHRLTWREFETLLFRIFQAQGFTCELGPGSNDGGIDVRVLQRDPLGDILTLVQAKRYSPKNKIDLSAVAALHGVADVEAAQKSMFVTTSDYLPSARKFAGRTRIPMKLTTSADVSEWCQEASAGIIRDKSKLVTRQAVASLLQSLTFRDPRIVHARTGYSVLTNQFSIILKETKHAALLMAIPAKTISDDGYGQRGCEVPDTGPACLDRLTADTVFRAKRTVHDGKVSYWDGQNLYTAWDGAPASFDLYD